MANAGSFKKGEKRPKQGRPKGTPNKLTKSVKEAFDAAFADAQANPEDPANLANFRLLFPKEFIAACSKLIPTKVEGDLRLAITPNINSVVEDMTKKKK